MAGPGRADEEAINSLVQSGLTIVSAGMVLNKGVYQLGLSDGSKLALDEGMERGADGGLYGCFQLVWVKSDGARVVLFKT